MKKNALFGVKVILVILLIIIGYAVINFESSFNIGLKMGALLLIALVSIIALEKKK